MRVLQIVPPHFYAERRRQAVYSQGRIQPVTVQALAARILQASGIVYKEDWVLETAAVWEAVEHLRTELKFFAPIALYPGFVEEVRWLISQLDYRALKLDELPLEARDEAAKLHVAYHTLLSQYGVLDRPGQLQRALEAYRAGARALVDEFEAVELVGLHELSPLEHEFVAAVAAGRRMQTVEIEEAAAVPTVTAAPDPAAEVEEIARAVRRQLDDGLSPAQITVAFPDPRAYSALLLPIFAQYHIPWDMPAQSLANLPLGRAVAAFLDGEVEGWHKSHLQLLTAPGWGLPIALTEEERRALRLAPPLEGIPAWLERLGEFPGWARALQLLRQASESFPVQPVGAHARSLQRLLEHFPPESWGTNNIYVRAELLKSWDALQLILDDLRAAASTVSFARFAQLLKVLMVDFRINAPRSLADRVSVLPINRLGAAKRKAVHVGGLVQGEFPKLSRRHWLTGLKAAEDGHMLYKLILSAADEVYLYYPETDREGKLNLPSTVIPATERKRPHTGQRLPGWRATPEFQRLADPRATQEIRERILKEGLSVSQLNRYARCPYQFFCAYVLGLEPMEEETLELTALDEGRIVHRVLQRFWQHHGEEAVPTLPQGQAEIERLLREEYEALGRPLPGRTLRTLRRFIRRDLDLVSRGGWRPMYLEKKFSGLMIPLPAADGAELQVEIRGVIDRIDVAPDGSYVLYDYKIRSAPAAKDVRTGRDVQIATYLLAAQKLLPRAENVGVGYYVVSEAKRVGLFREDWVEPLLLKRSDNCLTAEDFAGQLQSFEDAIRAMLVRIFAGEFPADPSDKQVCSSCPYQHISRREVGAR